MKIGEFKQLPIMGILRGIEPQSIEPLTGAVISSGLKTVEIAMNTKDAPALIGSMVRAARGRIFIGAGTVLTRPDLEAALDAGATFIVMPVFIEEIVTYCTRKNIPVFPGAFTPAEIYNAWNAGASMVKVFPAKFFGPAYIKEIKGPFNDIELLACGGINNDNIASFFAGGASAVAFGESIFNKKWILAGEFEKVQESIRSLLAASGKL